MTSKEFFNKVALLRHWQKNYFASRSHDALTKAKALEKEIDNEIARVNRILEAKKQNSPQQSSLFPE